MKRWMHPHWRWVGLALLLGAAILAFARREAPVDYNTEVKPILNKHCLSCHGGVKKKGGFSLLSREEALAPTASGKPALVPGDPDASEMIRRLRCSDPEERMPYRKAPLSDTEVQILRDWVAQGAEWSLHWAYRPLEKPELPNTRRLWWQFWKKEPADNWSRSDLDRFIWRRLQSKHLSPQSEAPRSELLQRVCMDLIGLPPSDSLRRAFLSDTSAQAYERLVDTLLASPRFGERWASMWLDLARYADSKGYERDAERYIWRYRDWVIRALNEDMPYDRFLTEQLAGDLLPDPDDQQMIATAFHRNTMTNDEGGTDNEEFRVAAVMDRVHTTWEALMSTTFACVQCHSHPYDPFYHREYYQFYAFFNQSRDCDTWEEYPVMRHFAGKDSLKMVHFENWTRQHLAPQEALKTLHFLKTMQPSWYSIHADSFQNCELYDTKWLTMRQNAACRLPQVDLDGKSQLIFRYNARVPGGRWTVRLGRPDGPVLIDFPVDTTNGRRKIVALDFPPQKGTHHLYFFYQNPKLNRTEDADLQFDWFHFTTPYLPKPEWAGERADFWELLRASTRETPIMMDGPKGFERVTQVMERGNWLVKGDTVQPGVPRILPPMPPGAPLNRLGLAQWMTQPEHPLTARTIANRIWEQLFGYGLAETLEDLGSQGAPPVYPEVLDYLSWNLIHRHGWSLKQLLREVVCSAVYRQNNRCPEALMALDPQNRLLARGPRVRLSAEQIRDKALAVSGALSVKMYGPGVMPFQPAGVWKSPWNGNDWKMSTGEDRYRRAVYTYWKRSGAYPSALTFDAVSREVCTARRVRTNTPLQALAMMNDSAMVDLAHIFVQNIEKEPLPDVQRKIERLFERAMGYSPPPEKSAPLLRLYERALALLGDAKYPEREALAVVANTVFNLDEFVMK